MTGKKYSFTPSSDNTFNNPISSAKMNKLLDLLALKPANRVLDIGAGNCEISIRLIEKYGVHATAIEIHEQDIKEAQINATGRIPLNKLDIIKQDVNTAIKNYDNNHFDLGICIGATHAIGNYHTTISALKKYVKKGGLILIADCYWKIPPLR